MIQGVGILLAICAILVVSFRGNVKQGTFHVALLLLFLFGGMSEFSNKLFQKFGSSSEKAYFLLIVFSVAFLVSLTMTFRHGKMPTRKDVLTGICVGIPNMFSSFFFDSLTGFSTNSRCVSSIQRWVDGSHFNI